MNDELLYRIREVADHYSLDSDLLRPCVARMLGGEQLIEGKQPRAWLAAVELKCIEVTEDRAREILLDSGICRRNEVPKTIRSAFKQSQNRWQCKSEIKQPMRDIRDAYCVGVEVCYWFASHSSPWQRRAATAEDKNFKRYGWHHIVSSTDQLLYFEIIRLEKLFHVGPGGLLLRNHVALAHSIGCSAHSIRNSAKKLADLNLIYYRTGTRNTIETRASEFKRIIPIPEPKPSPENRRKLEAFHHYERYGRLP